MRKKRACCLILTVVLFLCLCGCTDSRSGEIKTKNAHQKQKEDTENVLTVWCWDPTFNMNAMEKAEKVYQKTHPEFKLDMQEYTWDAIQTKVKTAAMSGEMEELPDIILVQDNTFQKNVITYPDAFVDLTNTSIAFDKFAKAKVGVSTVDGKNYGVPFDNGAVIGCYRTDILSQAGYSISDFENITWDQYIAQGQDILAKTGKPLLSCVEGGSDIIEMMLQSAGGSFYKEDGSIFLADNEILKEVAATYARLVQTGVLKEVNDWEQYVGSINNGEVAGTINGCWIMATITAQESQSGLWDMTNMPKFANISSATNYSNQGGSSWAVTAGCDNLKLAADFLGSTFGGSVELYEDIIDSGALACYLPAAESEAYGKKVAFFSDKPVFNKITEYAGKIPVINKGVYFNEARAEVVKAVTSYIGGADLVSELRAAEDAMRSQIEE